MKKSVLILAFLLLLVFPALADSAWQEEKAEWTPGTRLTLAFSAGSGKATVYLTDPEGRAICTLPAELDPQTGAGTVTVADLDLAEGDYLLFLVSDGSSSLPLTVLPPLPEILDLDAPSVLSDAWAARVQTNTEGTVVVSLSNGTEVGRAFVQSGDNTVYLSSALSSGTVFLDFRLIDSRGRVSDVFELEVQVPEPEPSHPVQDTVFHTPNELAGTACQHDACFWNLEMGNLQDVDKIWQVLTAPLTVIEGSERHQYKIRKEPRSDCEEYTGEVTCLSQGVHILEAGETWTRIEAYSSSVEGSRVGVFASCFTGYVETAKLREQPVSQDVALIVDKLQQRIFVFYKGQLFSTLLCSTGFTRSDTPFNETPAGEFYAISHTGGFWANELFCDMGIRINDGILLHEVPCKITEEADGTKTRHYETYEGYLGEKASHGCIRIQRATGVNGVSIKWLWENLPRTGNRAKVVIWDDSDRVLGPASDDFLLYYNPDNGRQYHSTPTCPQVNEKFYPLKAFTYGELETAPYSKLRVCPGCCPQLRVSGVELANRKNDGHAYDRIRPD